MTDAHREGREVQGIGRLPGTARPSRPSGPPVYPTDAVGATWVEGVVTRAGTGPCYGMLTDDGREYALYTRAGVELELGYHVRALVAAASFRIDCGPGELRRLLEVHPLGDGAGR